MVKILQHHTVVRDGWHNMLTDLVFWRDYYWLVYCRRTGHYSVDGGNIVLLSVDLKRWHEAARFKTVGDDREPKFCLAGNRLFIYFGTFFAPGGIGLGPMNSHVCFTDDGISWSDPTPVWKNQWLWRVRYQDGAFYGAAYGWQGDPRDHIHGPLDLLTSQNGINWKKISTITGVEDRPNEADLFFQPDGELWAIVRTWRKPQHSLFFSSKPPYTKWERVDLKVTIHCPCFCKSDGKLYVAGRRAMNEPWIPQPTPAGTTAIWTVEKGRVKPLFALPSDGDAAYPGLISREPGKLIISYYSQHAYLSGVLSSKIPIPPSGVRPDIYVGDDDVYIAEIAVEC